MDVATSSNRSAPRPTRPRAQLQEALAPLAPLADPLRSGLVGGLVVTLLALIGIIGKFSERAIISGVVSLGHTLLLLVLFVAAYQAAGHAVQAGRPRGQWIVAGALAGLAGAVMVSALVVLGENFVWVISPTVTWHLRDIFINASPELWHVLTFTGSSSEAASGGIPVLLGVGVALGVLGGLAHFLPAPVMRAATLGVIVTLLLALLGDLTLIILRDKGIEGLFTGWLLAEKGLAPAGALVLFALVAGLDLLWNYRGAQVRAALDRQPPPQQRLIRLVTLGVGVVLLLALPQLLGSYPSDVLNTVGLFLLMGLGLNIVVGFAGMLDLGYVAFFALGAYTVGVLTSPERMGLMNFWEALPFAIAIAVFAGIILGVPVLRLRGDYLAIVTLGFGEIIRLMALSEWLRPYIGGAQGIAGIPPIAIPPITLGGLQVFTGLNFAGPDAPKLLFYVILAGCALAAFVATRLKRSRLGRAWMAIREDEDVAQAMGMNLVWTKLLAFAVGAGFSGLSGALFDAKLGSIYPHSFSLQISINILALIIVGGMGSIPGVVVGALALVGLPELLREFAEFRLLAYGAVLIIMMLRRPEGLLPDTAHRRELREVEEPAPTGSPAESAPEKPLPVVAAE